MLRALIHVGLATLLVIAPALCCCNVRLLAGQIIALSSTPTRDCPSCPEPTPALPSLPACCQTEAAKPVAKPAKKASCCHEAEPTPLDTKNSKPAPAKPKPTAPKPNHCDICDDHPAATTTETAPTVAATKPTGALLPLAFIGLATIPLAHLGLLDGLKPPERAGVDTRSATLFLRHVLRC